MTELFVVTCLLLGGWASAASAQELRHPRVGLPDDGGDGPRLDAQPGYPVVAHDPPFGERYRVRLRYYNVSHEPRRYLKRAPFEVACRYSALAYWTANAAVHPYWFRDFGLERMCRQDVCLSIWLPDCSHDLMYKVTDVCDPKDCPSPLDIKVEPYKGRYLFKERRPGVLPTGPVYMYFVKCWADGLPQPELAATLPPPAVRNSRHWMISTMRQQWARNQAWNAAHGRERRRLGDLCRPPGEATTWLRDFDRAAWPPGSGRRVRW